MASSQINWEDFATEALLVQRQLIDEHTASIDSPQFINKITEPRCLVALSPESTPPTVDVTANTVSVSASLKQNGETEVRKQKEILVRTHLKDCTNTSLQNVSIKNENEIPYATPEKTKDNLENVPCPSSAEFRDFLTGIMEMSPVLVEDSTGSLESTRQEHSFGNRISGSNGRRFSGEGMRLDQMQQDVVKSNENDDSAQSKLNKDTFDSDQRVEDVVISAGDFSKDQSEETEEQHPSKDVTNPMPDDPPVPQRRARTGTYDLLSPTFDLSNTGDNDSAAIPQSNKSCFESSNDEVFLSGDKWLENNNIGSHENNCKDEMDSHFEVPSIAVDGDLEEDISRGTQKSAISENRRGNELNNVVEPAVHKCSRSDGLTKQEKNNYDDHVKVGLLVAIDDSEYLDDLKPCERTNSATDLDKTATDFLDTGSEQPIVKEDCELKETSKAALVGGDDIKISQTENEDKAGCAENVVSSVCSSGDGQAVFQNKEEPAPKKVLGLKRGLSTSSLPSKMNKNAQSQVRRSTGLPKSTATKLPQKSGIAIPKLQNAVSHKSQVESMKGGDANILSKTITRPQTGTSRLARKESLEPAKLLQPPRETKLSLRPPIQLSKPGAKPRSLLKMPQLPDRPRLITKVSGQQMVKVLQPAAQQATSNNQHQDNSKTVTKISRQSSVKSIQPPRGSVTSVVAKDTSSGSKPVLPVVDPAKTVTKDPIKKGPLRAFAPAGEAGAAKELKKPAPVKAIFPINGSRTVTKEDQPIGSRTVTKNDQPAGSRTVTKDAGGGSAESVRVPQDTPMKSEKSLAPKRLSDVFHSPAKLSENAREDGKKLNSFIPTPTRLNRSSSHSSKGSAAGNSSFRKPSSLSDFESPFGGSRGSGDDSSAFRPRRPLVQNTPDVEPRRESMWSPVKKVRVPAADMPYFCTKRIKGSQESSQ